MTFYPAGLSLILELMYTTDGRPGWDVRQIINTLPKEDSQSPVVHHVRVTATSMLIILHVICRWPLNFHPSAAEFVFSLTSIMEVTLHYSQLNESEINDINKGEWNLKFKQISDVARLDPKLHCS